MLTGFLGLSSEVQDPVPPLFFHPGVKSTSGDLTASKKPHL